MITDMKIVELDRNTLGYDIDTGIFAEFGDFEEHDSDTPENSRRFIKDADIVIFNKSVMNEEMLKDADKVKLLSLTDCENKEYTRSPFTIMPSCISLLYSF